jgi:hypothetical protein
MRNFGTVMYLSHVFQHVKELLQKRKSAIRVLPLSGPQLKLGNKFVAVRMEHSQVVDHFIYQIQCRVFSIMRVFAVPLVRILSIKHLTRNVDSYERPQNWSGRNRMGQYF